MKKKTWKKDNPEKEISEKHKIRKGNIWKRTILKIRFWKRTIPKRNICKNTIMKRKSLKQDNFEKEISENGSGQQVGHCGQKVGHCGQHGPNPYRAGGQVLGRFSYIPGFAR